jgi:hypothetical protein
MLCRKFTAAKIEAKYLSCFLIVNSQIRSSTVNLYNVVDL